MFNVFSLVSAADNIQHINPMLIDMLPKIIRSQDAYAGQSQWLPDKLARLNFQTQMDYDKAEVYLLRHSAETMEDWRLRLHASHYQNFYKPAIEGYVGMLSQYNMSDDIPQSMLQWDEDINREGANLRAFLLQCDRRQFMDGFVGVLVDYRNNRPYLALIHRQDIISWRHDLETGKLVQLVIRRSATDYGEFKAESYNQYWKLTPGLYEVYRDQNGNAVKEAEYEVRSESGAFLDEIPITFYPHDTLHPWGITPPLYELAESNFCHYNLYSTYSWGLNLSNFVMVVRIGAITAGEENRAGKLVVGNYGMDLPLGGDLKLVEPTGSSAAPSRLELDKLEMNMKSLTLSFLQGGFSSSMTEDEVQLRSAQTRASMATLATQKQSAFAAIVRNWCLFTGEEPTGELVMNANAISLPLSPAEWRELRETYITGMLSVENFWKIIQARGGIPEGITIEELLGGELAPLDGGSII